MTPILPASHFNPPTVVVTGANGFIGRRLIQSLSGAGLAGIAISRRDELVTPPGWTHMKRSRFLSEDVPIGVDCIVHLEARHHVFHRTAAEIADLERVNIGGTREMLQRASQLNCPAFIYFSSIKAVRSRDGINTEAAEGPGLEPYGQSKWEAEQLVRAWARERSGRCAIILRPAVVYGPGNQANLYSMLDAVARRRFPMVNGGCNVKSIVSLENVCGAVKHLLGRLETGISTFNIVDPESYPICKIADMMAHSLHVKSPRLSIPLWIAQFLALFGDGLARVGIQCFPINSTRLNGLMEASHFSAGALFASGFVPVETTEQGIARLAEWYRSMKLDSVAGK